MAAVERSQFEVQEFLSKSEISGHRAKLYEVFPAPVGEAIERKIGIGG